MTSGTTARARRWLPAGGLVRLVAVAAAVAGAGGCGAVQRPPPLPSWVPRAASQAERASGAHAGARSPAPVIPPPHVGSMHGRDPAADLVVAALQDEGLAFGTDGSMGALWGYLRHGHRTVRATEVEPGDVVFFQLHPERRRGCDSPDHAGLVVEPGRDGRVVFLERRAGETRKSYVDPTRPLARRGDDGRIRNSFLRPRHLGDSAEIPLYAGEMFCAAVRARP